MMAFRNTTLGLPAEHGAADVDRLYELRLRDFDPRSVEQVTAGVDVQADRLVHVVLGFDAGTAEVWVLDYGSTLGDPTEDDVWAALTSSLSRSFAGLPVSCVSVDAGFHTAHVRRQCSRRRWWVPVVSRAGEGKPIARSMGAQGVTTAGKDDTCAWWSGRIAAGRVHLPREITRARSPARRSPNSLRRKRSPSTGAGCAGSLSRGARITCGIPRGSPFTPATSGRGRRAGADCGWSPSSVLRPKLLRSSGCL